MEPRPCKDGRHDYDNTGWQGRFEVRCSRCPVVITKAALIAAGNTNHAVDRLARQSEREWYIQELES